MRNGLGARTQTAENNFGRFDFVSLIGLFGGISLALVLGSLIYLVMHGITYGIDSAGPQVGSELKRNGFLAVFYCLMVILIYVALRFDYKYSPGAVVCLFHDAVITLGIFVAVGKEVNIPIMAAILTLIGYSLND